MNFIVTLKRGESVDRTDPKKGGDDNLVLAIPEKTNNAQVLLLHLISSSTDSYY
jgi:hypothetical protein